MLAAEALFIAGFHEAAGFYAYHAFESMGGALCTSVGENYSMDHTHKINQFVGVAKRGVLRDRIGRGVSEVAALIMGIRNQLLYPRQVDDEVTLPTQVLSQEEARGLLKRVKGICKKVEEYV